MSSRFGMSMCVLGMAGELRNYGIGVNALWPKTVIDTAAVSNIVAPGKTRKTRKPEIMADAAFVIISQPASFRLELTVCIGLILVSQWKFLDR